MYLEDLVWLLFCFDVDDSPKTTVDQQVFIQECTSV